MCSLQPTECFSLAKSFKTAKDSEIIRNLLSLILRVDCSVTRRFGQNFAKVLKKVAKKVAKAFLATKRYIQAILWCLGPLFMAQVMAQSKKLPEISSLKIAQKLKYFTKKVQNWPFLPFEKWFIALKTKNFAHFKKQPKISPFSLATFLKKNFAKAHKKQPKWRNFATSGHTGLFARKNQNTKW